MSKKHVDFLISNIPNNKFEWWRFQFFKKNKRIDP